MTSREIRERFIKFFEENGHTHVPSSSLIPHNDPTLLFANAGMNQFKEVFQGQAKLPYTRAVSVQKCVRAGGKHNDLDSVGRTPRHQTFFEMLGNFSFGDYFKKDAIRFAWTFLTKELQLPLEKLWVTVFETDDEAYDIWANDMNVPTDRIIRLGAKDNFWSMGETGPCGPCSEIFFDRGDAYTCDAPECGIGKCDCSRYMEIWNLVFMQYNRDAEGNMTPLPRPSIDTGMGLERISTVMQHIYSNYDTDLLRPLIAYVESMTGKTYVDDESGFPFRVIADHSRSCTFLIGDGVVPSNEGRGYVLRRILRRAVRYGQLLGFDGPFLYNMVDKVIDIMGEPYPEIRVKSDYIKSVIESEEKRFFATLTEGLKKAEALIAKTKAEGRTEVDGQDAFLLYDTYGFPVDLTDDLAQENGLIVDQAGFEAAMQVQRTRAKAMRDVKNEIPEEITEAISTLPATEFLGYETLEATGKVLFVSENIVLLDATPFYGESGGQVADHGTLKTDNAAFRVENVKKTKDGKFLHLGTFENGTFLLGDSVSASVCPVRRAAIARNHTTTHLLHKALKLVLGEHVNQAGSLVEPTHLRFDFNHFKALTEEEKAAVEALVNEKILSGMPVVTTLSTVEEAVKDGAMALFGEKYGQAVRVLTMGDFSKELCGGTHVKNTGEIGLFKLVSESSVGAGLRRIEGITGLAVLKALDEKDLAIQEAAEAIKAKPADLVDRARQTAEHMKELERELESLKAKLRKAEAGGGDDIHTFGAIKAVSKEVSASDMDELRQQADLYRDMVGSGVVILGAQFNEKVSFVVTVTKDIAGKNFHAGNIVKEVAKVTGGGGGGRPDMAQAGGKDASKMAEALALGLKLVEEAAQ